MTSISLEQALLSSSYYEAKPFAEIRQNHTLNCLLTFSHIPGFNHHMQ